MNTLTNQQTSISEQPLVSLLVCTYNRASVLGQTLDSLLSQDFGWGTFEVLVIDNASTDDTKAVVEGYRARDPRVRYALEPRLGVAKARNTGARLARAPYIAFFDDDQLADPDCLHELIGCFQKIKPTPAAAMGKVDLLWEMGRPDWFPEQHESLLSRFDRGDEPRWLQPDEYLITMNVAFERSIFLESGGIREDLSRMGRMFICSGDNEIFERYMQRGLPIFYQPRARVRHLVPLARQRRTWLFKRIFGEGTSQIISDYAGASRAALLHRTLYDMKLGVRFGLHIITNRRSHNHQAEQEALLTFIRQAGRLSAELQLLAGVRNVNTLSE